MKAKPFIATLIAATLLTSGITFAGEKRSDLELKSEGLAWALGLDPIPGDALFYGEKPIQGAANFLLGGVGAYLFYWGLFAHLNSRCKPTNSDSMCGVEKYVMIGGAMLYLPALIWDAIGGVSSVYSHNKKVRQQQSSFLNTFRPTLAVTKEGVFAGAEFNF
jgi:hypothetical protein